MSRRFGRVTTVLLFAAAVAACADSPTSPTSSSPTRSLSTVLATPPSSCGAVLGPSTFTRATGAPVAERIAFAAAQPGDWYQLVVTGADAAGTSAWVALNGRLLFNESDHAAARFELPVTLAADNVLELRLTGRPGTGIQLSIVDARPVASVRIVPDIVQGTAYVLKGATQDFGAEVRDAQGRPLATRCVTWRTTDAAVATADAAGTVHALAEGSTQLVAAAGGVEDTISITVLVPEYGLPGGGKVSTPGPCIWSSGYFGCFAAEVSTSVLADGRTLITVKIRNRQGGGPLADAPQSLPATVISRIQVLDRTGRIAWRANGFSIALDSAVGIVGSTPTASITTDASLMVANPPYGYITYQGWEIDLQRGISGCDTPSPFPTPAADWRTCGVQGGWVTFSFISGMGERSASDLFLYVSMSGMYFLEPTTLSCANTPSSLTDFPSCRPGGPLAP